MAPDCGEGQAAHPAASASRALQSVVVQHNWFAVGGQPNIELDPTAAERLCLAEAGEGVFRGTCSGAAMADYRRQDSFDPSVLPEHSG